MLEYLMIEVIAKERMRALAANAEKHRMLEAVATPRRSTLDRILLFTGELLIAAGTLIQRRYQPMATPELDTNCVNC